MLTKPASHYLIPPPNYFWRWDQDDHAAVWADGSTMAFARELIPLMKELAGDIGLPPLGAMLILLVVAKQPQEWQEKWRMAHHFAKGLGVDGTMPNTIQRFEGPILRGLHLVAGLPDTLRAGQSARLHLLRVLFAPNFNRLPVQHSLDIVDEFRAATSGELRGEHDLGGMTRLLRDFKALNAALEKWTATMLENALCTGVKNVSLEDAATDDAHLPRKQTGDLWSELEHSQSEELRAVASLARQLLAVIHLPRPLHRHEDQPVGGVSDISNKGDPSRLLLSELAHDEDILAVRLAFNEALYLRRETPPATPLPRRFVLLDNGILLWGRARLYATAVALALLKPCVAKEEVELRGHHRKAFEPLQLASAGDLRVWWSRLDPAADCRRALDQALAEMLGDKPEAQPEIVLITHVDAAGAMAPWLNEREWPAGARFFVITVTGTGRCVVHQRSQTGAKEIAAVNLEPPKALLSA